ncbi:MAG: MFS transporter [Mycobacteriaceae bacterium]
MKRLWLIWSVGVIAYTISVLNRTSFGVSGVQAAERFQVNASWLSTFVVLQMVVYAGLQIPAGLLLDKYGSRIMIAIGALTMSAGQALLAVSEQIPQVAIARILVGIGDAFTFISVLRLVTAWFPSTKVPVMAQITGIVGQLGQVLSAIPLLAVLRSAGWSTAFVSIAALTALSGVLVLLIIVDTPSGTVKPRAILTQQTIGQQIKQVWMRPGTRLGFFSHMGTQFSITTFVLMWGVPYLVSAQELSITTAGSLLTVSVMAIISSGPILGYLTGRFPFRRSWLVLAIMGSNAALWTTVLCLSGPAPLWLLVLLIVVISVGGPGSMIGFDYARTFNEPLTIGTAQGIVNVGGFLASLLLIEAMGLVLDWQGGYSFDAFRLAWLLQYPIWGIAALGVLITRWKVRRELAKQGIKPTPLKQVLRRFVG